MILETRKALAELRIFAWAPDRRGKGGIGIRELECKSAVWKKFGEAQVPIPARDTSVIKARGVEKGKIENVSRLRFYTGSWKFEKYETRFKFVKIQN